MLAGKGLARGAVAILIGLGSLAVGCAPPPAGNLVLVSLDTLAPDRMSTYGNARETTPTVSALAAEGVVFTRAYSTSSWTLPAHASMLTGRYPAHLTSQGRFDGYRAAPMLSQRFRERGYRTAAVTGGGYVSAAFGADRGFDLFEEGDAERAAAWLGDVQEPFFLFFHTYLPHALYTDRRFASEPGLSPGRLRDAFATPGRELDQAICCQDPISLTPDEREYLLALYDSDVAAADEEVARLLAALDRRGLRDRTTLIVTSDHGEEFWQHTGWAARHGHTLYDELLRIPLVWVEPGSPAPGSRCDVPVSLVDLVPTLVARFDLGTPGEVDGIDVGSLLEACASTGERPLFAEGIRDGALRFSVRTSRGKLIATPRPRRQRGLGRDHPIPVLARRELYLPGDPEERDNAIDREDALALELDALLRAHRAQALDGGAVADPTPATLDEPTLRRLRELGYVE